MEFKQHLAELEHANLETNETATGRITIKQSMRNKLRKELMHEFYQFLIANDINAFETSSGIIVNIENEGIGDVNIELKLSLKGLDFNLEEELDKFEIAQQAKIAKAK